MFIWEGFMKYADEMVLSDMIYKPSSTKMGTGVQAILTFNLSSSKGYNVDITDRRYLRSALLRLAKVPWYTH
jgi:hypothetical protein